MYSKLQHLHMIPSTLSTFQERRQHYNNFSTFPAEIYNTSECVARLSFILYNSSIIYTQNILYVILLNFKLNILSYCCQRIQNHGSTYPTTNEKYKFNMQ